jgi:hypothetical protein
MVPLLGSAQGKASPFSETPSLTRRHKMDENDFALALRATRFQASVLSTPGPFALLDLVFVAALR